MSSKFDCKMECDRFGDWCIRITHNGYQWTAVGVQGVGEANKLIALLQGWVRQQETKESAGTDTQHAQHKICPYCDNGSVVCEEDYEMSFPCQMCGGTGKLRASAQ